MWVLELEDRSSGRTAVLSALTSIPAWILFPGKCLSSQALVLWTVELFLYDSSMADDSSPLLPPKDLRTLQLDTYFTHLILTK